MLLHSSQIEFNIIVKLENYGKNNIILNKKVIITNKKY